MEGAGAAAGEARTQGRCRVEVEGRVAGAGEAAGEARAQGKVPNDCWDGRLRAQGVSGAVGKGRGQVRGSVSRRFDRATSDKPNGFSR